MLGSRSTLRVTCLKVKSFDFGCSRITKAFKNFFLRDLFSLHFFTLFPSISFHLFFEKKRKKNRFFSYRKIKWIFHRNKKPKKKSLSFKRTNQENAFSITRIRLENTQKKKDKDNEMFYFISRLFFFFFSSLTARGKRTEHNGLKQYFCFL